MSGPHRVTNGDQENQQLIIKKFNTSTRRTLSNQYELDNNNNQEWPI